MIMTVMVIVMMVMSSVVVMIMIIKEVLTMISPGLPGWSEGLGEATKNWFDVQILLQIILGRARSFFNFNWINMYDN